MSYVITKDYKVLFKRKNFACTYKYIDQVDYPATIKYEVIKVFATLTALHTKMSF